MQDKSTNIDKVLRNAISAKQADTAAKRQLIYEAAERALDRSLGQNPDERHLARVQGLRRQLHAAIGAIEDEISPPAVAPAFVPLPPQLQEQPVMTTSPPPIPPRAPAAAPARRWLPIAAVLVLAVAAGGGWYAYTLSQATGNVPTHAQAAGLRGESYDDALAKLKLDPQIRGFVDRMRVDEAGLAISGWAVDPANYAEPVSVLAYAGDALIGAAGSQGKRPDLKIEADPDAAYSIAVGDACPKGTPLNVIGVTSDGRYAPLKFFKLEAVCP